MDKKKHTKILNQINMVNFKTLKLTSNGFIFCSF